MFSEIYPLLQEFNSNLTEADWRSLFDYKWKRQEEYCGYGLFDGPEIVGFLGLIFSQRVIDHNVENFCHLAAWIVKENYRMHSFSLMMPVLKLDDHTLVDLSPTSGVARISKRLGFTELESRIKVLLPWPISTKPYLSRNFSITQDKNLIGQLLSGSELTIFHDHQHFRPCRHLVVKHRDKHCYVIYTTVRNSSRVPYCYIHYVSEAQAFAKFSFAIRTEIIRKTRIPWVVVDSRLVQSVRLPFSPEFSLSSPKLFKSAGLRADQIDNLYSELIMFDFDSIPQLNPSQFVVGRKAFRAVFNWYKMAFSN